MEWLSKLFDVHKLPFKVILWVSIVSGALLFAPDAFVEKLKLSEFISRFSTYIGVAFVASTALVLVNIPGWLTRHIQRKTRYKKWKNNLSTSLNSLDHAEKAVLREFFIHGKYTIELPMNESTVVGLRNKGIVYVAGNYGQHTLAGMLIPFAISDEARKLITYEMINFPAEEPTEQEIQFVKQHRPDFVREIERRNALFRW